MNLKANTLGSQTGSSLGTSLNGSLNIPLSSGNPLDNNRLYFYVNVIDNDNGITVYSINTPVEVDPNSGQLTNIIASISNPTGALNTVLSSGNSQAVAQTLLNVATLLNTGVLLPNSSNSVNLRIK